MTPSRATLDAAALYELTAAQFMAIVLAAHSDQLDALLAYYTAIRQDTSKAAVSRAIAFKRCWTIRDELAAREASAKAITADFIKMGFVIVEIVTIPE